MDLSFTGLHWGDRPRRRFRGQVYTGPARSIGAIKALSYATRKDGRATVWRHQFHPPGPDLLTADPAGSERATPPPQDTIEVGRLVDVELADGRRVIYGMAHVVTSKAGSALWIVSEHAPTLAITTRDVDYQVTVRGIEG